MMNNEIEEEPVECKDSEDDNLIVMVMNKIAATERTHHTARKIIKRPLKTRFKIKMPIF